MPIICGGSLVTSVPHVFMNETACDVAVISEGEITILELMESYAAGRWEQRPAVDPRHLVPRRADGEVAPARRPAAR